MNIYFACSITGGREQEAVYQTIVASLLADGHIVPTAHLADPGIKVLENQVGAAEIYRRDVNWIHACDVLIAEVTTPSHGVGYEIGYALGLGKPVLCLHQAGRPVSKMLLGNPDPHLCILSYPDLPSALATIRTHLSGLDLHL